MGCQPQIGRSPIDRNGDTGRTRLRAGRRESVEENSIADRKSDELEHRLTERPKGMPLAASGWA